MHNFNGGLTNWSGVSRKLCLDNLAIIDSDNGLSPDRHQAIIWASGGIVDLTLRNKIQWNVNRNSNSFTQENAFERVVSGIFCLGLNVLTNTPLKLLFCLDVNIRKISHSRSSAVGALGVWSGGRGFESHQGWAISLSFVLFQEQIFSSRKWVLLPVHGWLFVRQPLQIYIYIFIYIARANF